MEAAYYEKQADNACLCRLCPHHCLIPDGRRGRCLTRKNEQGRLQALSYGRIASLALDPIEKKPLACFHPGSRILSLGSWGCNMACRFCQNWEIASREAPAESFSPQQVLALALSLKKEGNIGVAYTYNEPSTWYEFIRDTAPLIRKAGMVNVMVTNGFIEEAPLKSLLPFIDAWNIDLKGWNGNFYRTICGAEKEPVMKTILLAARVAHVEITHLTISGENDDPEDMDALAAWLATIRKDIPLHITRFFPQHHMQNHPPTPIRTLIQLRETARKHLSRVYIGNVSREELGEN